MSHPVLLFDGDCNFCRAIVRWMVEHDPAGTLRFAPLDSEPGKKLLLDHGIVPIETESVILLDAGTAYSKSEAVFESLQRLRTRWRIVQPLRVIPRPIRDFGYELVSKNRSVISRMVGTINHRYEPQGTDRDRFLAT